MCSGPEAINVSLHVSAADASCHHWQVLASQVAGETAAVLKSELGSIMEPIYVQSDYRTSTDDTACADRTPYKNTSFAQAFNSFLITALTKQGVPISFNPDNRLQICWAVQPLVHSADRIKPPFPLETTLLAGLGFGLAESWYQLSPGAAGAVTAFGVGPILDTLRGLRTGPLPHSEIIITTTITDRGVILAPMRATHTYSISTIRTGSITGQYQIPRKNPLPWLADKLKWG